MDVTTDDSLDTMKFRSHRRCPRECTLHDILDLEKKKKVCVVCVCVGGAGGFWIIERKEKKAKRKSGPTA